MPDFLGDKSEKKVLYIELIYDLIFVYLVSRNAALLDTDSGFVRLGAYMTYLASTLAILQIWYVSMLYINRYGDGHITEYIGLFINMYLLYHMADGIRVDWGAYYYRYTGAWALILLNLAVQYLLVSKRRGGAAWEKRHIHLHMRMLLIEAAILLASIPVYIYTGAAFAPIALVFGYGAALLTRRTDALVPVDFPHLSERVMLYIVFTFGEMLLGIAGYFSGGFTGETLYYSLMAFLIVAGLFSMYGYFYEKLLDHESATSGTGYMLLHIVMILALNNITAALEFMRHSAVRAVPKNAFMTVSLLVYFAGMLLTQRFAVKRVAAGKRFYGKLAAVFAGYCVLIAVFYRNAMVSVAVTAVFIYLQLFLLCFSGEAKDNAA